MIPHAMRRPASTTLLRLYVAGNEPSSVAARRSLDSLLQNPEFIGRVGGVIVDVLAEPQRARAAGLTSTPTLLVRRGMRVVRFIGDLSSVAPIVEFLQAQLSVKRP